MNLWVAWILYPLVLVALCCGLGLLVDLLTGRRLPGTLLVPIGLAATMVVGEFTTTSDATAELTVPILLFLAVLGAGFSLPWRFGRPNPVPLGVAAAVFAVFAAPVVLSGSPTFAGFIKLDDTATWFALTDRVMQHGHSLAGLEPSTYLATLEFNLAGGYPVGAFLPFGAAQKLVGGDLAWVFQPYLSFLAATLALALWEIAGSVVRRNPLRALSVFIAAQAALLYGYAMWGGVKELAAATLVALAAALAPAAVRRSASLRDVIPLAIAGAALVGVLSAGGLVWLAPMLLALAVLAVRRFELRAAAARALAFVVSLAVLSVPAISAGLVPPTSRPLTDPHAEGNLRGPLDALQALGIWPSGDFRFHPDATVATAVLIALGLCAALFGLWVAWRRRASSPLLYASAIVAAAAIVAIGSPWAGGKALATVSPVVLSLAVLGACAALRSDRFIGALFVIAVAGGVLWSNVLAYGGVNLAPYGQLAELEKIGKRFDGQGPALMTEYNPYGARHFLRGLDAEGVSELRTREIPLAKGGTVEKGLSADTDELAMEGLFTYRTLVLRRSPVRSRPPLPYRLVFAGRYYEVWQRPAGYATTPPEHLALGSPLAAAAVPSCAAVLGLAERNPRGRLVAARHAPVYDATSGSLHLPRGGPFVAWLKGSVRGSVELLVDGRRVGAARHVLNEEGGFIELGEPRLSAGDHRVELRFGGADLHPGSGGFPRPVTGPLLFTSARAATAGLVSVDAGEARRLCGRPWDWIEVGPET